jgi:CMP-N,N'-diacetyllegionaminic acid synthase
MNRVSNVLGLIPARGGSQGIPRKNIKLLGDRPLISYTIASALASIELSAVCVSTDDREIGDLALSYGASVPFIRPASLATSAASSVDVILHALDYYRSEGREFEAICLLQPTCPFRPRGQIDQAISLWRNSGSDSLVTVLPVPPVCNPYWVMFEREGCLVPALDKAEVITRRQDLPPAYQRSGSIYLVSCSKLLHSKSLFVGNVIPLRQCERHHVNLDSAEDWANAEALLMRGDEMSQCCGVAYER